MADPKRFQYDAPRPLLLRLFKLDLNPPEEPLSGMLLTLINTNAAFMQYDFMSIFKSFLDSGDELFKLLGEGEGHDALSYCWGSLNGKQPLHLSVLGPKLVDDQPVLNAEPHRNGHIWITESLAACLVQLRRQRYSRFIWIDAICIDQNDPVDKANQIPLMRHIYDVAKDILVWLGPATAVEEDVMRDVPALTAKLSTASDPSSSNSARLAELGWAGLTPAQRKALATIMTHPWWSRLWTLQEAAMGSVKEERQPFVHILRGNARIPWAAFEALRDVMVKVGVQRRMLALVDRADDYDQGAFDCIAEVRLCRQSLESGVGVYPKDLLPATNRRTATDPTDMVLGQLALIGNGAITVKAGDSVLNVYTEFGKFYMRQELEECLLNHVNTEQRLPGLPSWCPNFASRRETTLLGTRATYGGGRDDREDDRPFFHAGWQFEGRWRLPQKRFYEMRMIANIVRLRYPDYGVRDTKNPRQPSFKAGSGALYLSGCEVDRVEHVIECAPNGQHEALTSEDARRLLTWAAVCRSVAEAAAAKGARSDPLDARATLARTLVANRLPDLDQDAARPRYSFDGTHDFTLEYEDWQARVEQHAQHGAWLAVHQHVNTSLDHTVSTANGDSALGSLLLHGYSAYGSLLLKINRNRCFFSTAKGRIGLGPRETQVGDRVCVAFYCPTPYIMRPRDGDIGTWRMVGEAYVHGLMYGHALDMLDRKELRERKWVVT